VREELTTKIENVREELTTKIENVREELTRRIDGVSERIDGTNRRLDRLYEVVVKREEHLEVLSRISKLEEEIELLKRKIAV
jgi:chromosome segregation ATPase